MHQNYNGYGGQAFSAPFGSDHYGGLFDIFKRKEGVTQEERQAKLQQTGSDIISLSSGILSQFGPKQQPPQQQQYQAPPPEPGLPAWAKVLGGILVTGAVVGGGVLLYQKLND